MIFLLKLKFKKALESNQYLFVLEIIFALFSSLIGVFIQVLLTKESSPNVTILFVSLILILYSAFKFLIYYQTYSRMYPIYYPISNYSICYQECLLNWFNPFNLFFLFTQTVLAIAFKNFYFFLIPIMISLIIELINLNIRNTLIVSKKYRTILMSVNVFILIGIITAFYFKAFILFFPVLIFTSLIRIKTISLTPAIIEKVRSQFAVKNDSYLRIIIKMIQSNKAPQIPFFVATFLKLLILILGLFIYKKESKFVFDSPFVFLLFFSPMVFYTYILNNLFGFFYAYKLICIRSQSYLKSLIFLASLNIVILIFDGILTLISSWSIIGKEAEQFIEGYLLYTVCLFFISFIGSLFFPKKIEKNSILKNRLSSSLFTSSIALIPAYLIVFQPVKLLVYFTLAISMSSIISIILLKEYSDRKIEQLFYK